MTAPLKPSNSRERVTGVLPKPRPDIEVGYSAHMPFVTPYKNAWEALRDDDITVKQLIAMRRTDGQARALYRLITLPIRAALKTATFVPEEYVDGGEEEAEFIETMFTLPSSGGGMTVPFQRVVAQMLSAIFDGFSAFELVYWSPDHGPLEGKWTLKKIANRPAETLSFLLDDRSEFAGFRQRTMYQGRQIDVVIPPEHSLYYAANEEEKPFYGQSYFESAFYHWDKKFRLYVIAHLAAQRAAVGTRVGKLPKNPTTVDKAEFKRALADLGVAQYMTIPEDFSVESLKEFTGFDFLALINHHNSQMSKSVLAAFFDDLQGSGGDAALVDFGRQSDALFMMMLQTIMSELEDVINSKIIPRFIDWNFGTGKYPAFRFGSLTEEQKGAMLDLFKTLAVAGQSLAIRPEFVHQMEIQVAEEFGLEVDWDAVEDRMVEEEEQAALMAAAGLDPAMGGNPAAAGASPAAAVPGADKQGPAVIDPAVLPEGFTLSHGTDDLVQLTDLAAELLDDAAQTIRLVRGRTNSGAPKVVRTAEGARVYGVPIGTPITRDMEESRAGSHGVKGKQYGKNNTAKDQTKKTPTKRSTQGGGLGDRGNLGGVVTEGASGIPEPKATYTNPKVPGARLIDYGDGTVAIIDAQGRMSPRQRFNARTFAKFGWTIDRSDEAETTPKKAAKKPTARKTAPSK